MFEVKFYTNNGTNVDLKPERDSVLMELGKLSGGTVRNIKCGHGDQEGKFILEVEHNSGITELVVGISLARFFFKANN